MSRIVTRETPKHVPEPPPDDVVIRLRPEEAHRLADYLYSREIGPSPRLWEQIIRALFDRSPDTYTPERYDRDQHRHIDLTGKHTA